MLFSVQQIPGAGDPEGPELSVVQANGSLQGSPIESEQPS